MGGEGVFRGRWRGSGAIRVREQGFGGQKGQREIIRGKIGVGKGIWGQQEGDKEREGTERGFGGQERGI